MRGLQGFIKTLRVARGSLVVALLAVGLTTAASCRGFRQPAYGPAMQPPPGPMGPGPYQAFPHAAAQPNYPAHPGYPGHVAGYPPLPYPARAAGPMQGPPLSGPPVPSGQFAPWQPPGLEQPWPSDEWLVDGGDRGVPVAVTADWEVRGLETEDTIAHYDTLDGRVVVEPTNRVYIYSPRFASVRHVAGVEQGLAWKAAAGVATPTLMGGFGEVKVVGTQVQQTQIEQARHRDITNQVRTRQGEGVFSSAIGPERFVNSFKPYENFEVIRTGMMREAEMARLAEASQAAVTWTNNQAVQVVIDEQTVAVEVQKESAVTIYTVDQPPGEPKLKILKVASRQEAQVGETVDFTLRFDNVGTQTIGNVTLMDNLTARLEYVEGTAQCSVDANFIAQENESGSLTLRWEIVHPLDPGQGGIIRFHCRVR